MRVLFVHGAFVRDGAWWWQPVADLLQARGVSSTAVRLPSCGEAGVPPTGTGPGLADDVAATRAALDTGGPWTVVAHSYGGVVVSEAAAGRDDVEHLVYVSSFLPRLGESLGQLTAGGDDPVPVAPQADGSVRVEVTDAFDHRFLQDVTDGDLVRGAHERLTAQSASAFGTPVAAEAWTAIPSTYLVCAQDNSTAPDLQRVHAARAGRSLELPTGHHPMLSRPDLLADALLDLPA